MGKKQEQEKEARITKYANKLMTKKERKNRRKLTPAEIEEAFKRADRREEKRERIKKKFTRFLAIFGITVTIGGGAALLLNSGKEPEPESPSGQETDIDTEKDNEKPKTDREKWLEGLKEGKNINGTEESQNEVNEQLNDTIDAILEEYNTNLSEEEQITVEDLGIILRNNVGAGHIREVISEDGEKYYVDNPLISGILPEEQVWVDVQDIGDEYILVDTENNSTVAGMGTIHSMKTEIDVQYVNFGGQEYIKNDETYVGVPEGVDLEEAYEDFSDYYQFRIQQQEQQKNESQIQDDGFDR